MGNPEHPSHAEQVVQQAEAILMEAMIRHQRRLAADLAHSSLDEHAFALAVEAFDEEYADVCERYAEQGEPEGMHHDAQIFALERGIVTYLAGAGW